jgi:hypothetical protein
VENQPNTENNIVVPSELIEMTYGRKQKRYKEGVADNISKTLERLSIGLEPKKLGQGIKEKLEKINSEEKINWPNVFVYWWDVLNKEKKRHKSDPERLNELSKNIELLSNITANFNKPETGEREEAWNLNLSSSGIHRGSGSKRTRIKTSAEGHDRQERN